MTECHDVNSLRHEWKWNWHIDDEDRADCGIFAEPMEGHAYAVARCPQYLTQDQWRQYARHICDLHNAALKEHRQ